jgi:hypothetical protein
MLPVRYIRRILMTIFIMFRLGKTTILYKLKLGEIVTTIPTIGKLKIVLKYFLNSLIDRF